MSWKSYKLGDLLERKRAKAEIKPAQVYKLVTIRLWHQGVVLREEKSGQDIKSNMYHVNEGDFVLSGIDARNGAFGIVPKELEGAVVTNDFWCLEAKKSLLRKDFFLFLTSTKFFDYICNQCSDGTTQRIRLQKDKFYDFEIALPPVEEQGDLVKSLANSKQSNEHLSTELTHQLDLVKQLRQAFLREAMQGKLVPQDPNDEPASVLLEKIKAEKERLIKEKKIKKQNPLPPIKEEEIPFDIPENWVWCKIGDISTSIVPNRDKPKTFNGTIPWVTQTNFSEKSIKLDYSVNDIGLSIDEVKKYNCRIMPKGSIVMSCVGRFDLVCFIDQDIVANQQLHCFIPVIETMSMYLIYGIKLLNEEVAKTAIHTTIKYLNKTKIESIPLPLPSLSEQKRIVAKLDELMAYCDELEVSIKASQQQNEMLLQQVLREALEPEGKKF